MLESEAPVDGYEPRRNGKAAKKVVDELYKKYVFYQQVIDKLNTDKMLDEAVRKITLQIANVRLWEDTEKQKEQSQDPTPEEAAGSEE